MWSYIGQSDRNLMNAVKKSVASETPVMNVSLRVGQELDSSSTLHFLLMLTTIGKALEIVGNAREGEGLEAWRGLILKFDS